MQYKYKVEVGDWSNDGHNQSEVYYFDSTHPKNEILAAYHRAVKKSGVSLRDRDCGHSDVPREAKAICCEYEDGSISADNIQKLRDIGIDFDSESAPWGDSLEDDSSLSMSAEDMTYLFLEMVKTEIKGFEYKITNDSVEKIFDGFGYGCFY